jgi:hypothetical protein
MDSRPVDPAEPDVNAEFLRLFWTARDEHSRFRERATPDFPAHVAAVEFARGQGWPWAEALLEADRRLLAGNHDQAFQILADFESSVPQRWRTHFDFLQAEVLSARGDYDAAIAINRRLLDPAGPLHNIGTATGKRRSRCFVSVTRPFEPTRPPSPLAIEPLKNVAPGFSSVCECS